MAEENEKIIKEFSKKYTTLTDDRKKSLKLELEKEGIDIPNNKNIEKLKPIMEKYR
jgi:ribose 5-phosphate isomerase